MNRLNIYSNVNLGGHKLSLNDLNTLQLSILDVASAMGFIHGKGGNNIILSQLQIDERTNDFDLEVPAIVLYNGKIYRVEAAFTQDKTVGGEFKFRIDTLVDSDNPVVYEDGSSFNIHIDETMTLVHTTTTGANYITLDSFNSFNGWNEVEPATTNLDTADGGDIKELRWRVTGNTMVFSLRLKGTILANGTMSVTFPYRIRSAVDQELAIPALLDGTLTLFAGSLPDGQEGITFSTFSGTFSENDEINLIYNGVIEIKY